MNAPNLPSSGTPRLFSFLITVAVCAVVWFTFSVIRSAAGSSASNIVALLVSVLAFSGFLWRVFSGR
jgi:hypothetical protein